MNGCRKLYNMHYFEGKNEEKKVTKHTRDMIS